MELERLADQWLRRLKRIDQGRVQRGAALQPRGLRLVQLLGHGRRQERSRAERGLSCGCRHHARQCPDHRSDERRQGNLHDGDHRAFANAISSTSTELATYCGDQNVGTPTGATVLFANNDGGEFHKAFQLPASALSDGKTVTRPAASAGQNTAYTTALYELQNLTSVAQESHGVGSITNAPGHGRLYCNPTTAAQAAQVRIIMASFNDRRAATITQPSSGAIVDASNAGGLYSGSYYHAAIIARLPSAFASNPNVDSTVNMTANKTAYTQLLLS